MKVLADADHHTNNFGVFRLFVVQSDLWGGEHIVLVKGIVNNKEKVLCRIQSHCLPGIALDSSDCDCKSQLNYSLSCIEKESLGILIYLDQEGRGHGLTTKIKALNNKNCGMDTFEAVESLGLKGDIRTYDVAIEILNYFSPKTIRLLTNNPNKVDSVMVSNICIDSVINIPTYCNKRLVKHLQAKAARGHFIYFSEEDKNADG